MVRHTGARTRLAARLTDSIATAWAARIAAYWGFPALMIVNGWLYFGDYPYEIHFGFLMSGIMVTAFLAIIGTAVLTYSARLEAGHPGIDTVFLAVGIITAVVAIPVTYLVLQALGYPAKGIDNWVAYGSAVLLTAYSALIALTHE